MLKRLVFVVKIIFFLRPSLASYDESLNRLLQSTTIFFDQLKLNYESRTPNAVFYESIDEEINRHVDGVKKSENLSRGKRQLDPDEDVRVLNGFERLPDLDFSNAIDVTFFDYGGAGNAESRWYAAALNASGISLFQYQHRMFNYVGFFRLTNGTRIISHSSNIATLLVVQRSTAGDAIVVRLSQEKNQKTLQKVQTVDTPAVTDSSVWREMKKIYLAVSSPKNLKVFVWLGQHFDRVQTKNIGATSVVPFQTGGGIMHLLAIDQSRSSILKFLLRRRKFVIAQRLSGAGKATSFRIEKAHHGEYFLALAGKTSSVIYKRSKHRFVPFQEISSAVRITSMHDQSAILLFVIQNGGDMKIFQYDGWRFVELAGIAISGILDVRPVTFGDEDFLALMRHRETFNDAGRNMESFDEKTKASSGSRSNNATANFGAKIMNFDDNSPENAYSWEFRKIVWAKRETWSSLRERTKIWCQDSLNKMAAVPANLPQQPPKGPLRIERGYIQTIRASEINGQSVERFVKLDERLNAIAAKTKEQEESSKLYVSTVDPVFKNLRAANVRVNCTNSCRAERTKTAAKEDFLDDVRWIDEANGGHFLNFRNVKASRATKFPCPYPAPKFQHVTVDGLVNGISFSEFVEDVLKVTGDQRLTGSHTFAELRARNARIPLDVASNFTHQEILAANIETNELNITSGGFLLPLRNDGGSPAMSGTLTVSKGKLKGGIELRGKINGTGSAEFSPIIRTIEPIELFGNFSLENVKILENLRVKDIGRSSGKSLGEIISKALPLDADHVPALFKMRNDKVTWSNVTLRNFPYKWLTKKHSGHVVITGHKNATNGNLTMDKSTYENLPIPRLASHICGIAAISPDLRESNLVIDEGRAINVKAIDLYGESMLTKVYSDSVDSPEDVPWELKNLTGRMIVKMANIGEIDGMNYPGWKNTVSRWIEPGRLRGPVRIENLNVNELIITQRLVMPLPDEVGNVEIKGNLYVGAINNIDVDDFMRNAVMIDDNLSLTNVTFAGGLVAKRIFASDTSFSLQDNLSSGYLGSKEILGTLESEEIVLSNFIHRPTSGKPFNIIVNGNVEFTKEPEVINVNDKSVKTLYEGVWLTDRPTKIIAKFVEFKNLTLESDLKLLKSFDTPNLGSWSDLENRLLSKTKPQTINVDAWFKLVRAPNIIASREKSHLRSNISYLYDLEFNSLKNNNNNNDSPIVTNNWDFEEMIITGDFDIQGRINGLNLTSDVVRSDVEKNQVKGRKIFRDLNARNVAGIDFDKFAANALRRNNENRTIVVKGWKTFENVETKDIRLDGRIMGAKIEESLLKSGKQNLRGKKVFEGSVRTPAIVTEGLVNDIKLPHFVDKQLKKRASSQTIETPIFLSNNMTIFGNVTIDGTYNGVEFNKIHRINDNLESVADKTLELLNFAEGIELAFDNRAIYWDGLELVEESSKSPIFDSSKNDELSYFEGLGRCEIRELHLSCEEAKFFYPLPIVFNGGAIFSAKIINLWGISLVATVNLDPGGGIFIFRYDLDEKKFRTIAGLNVPGIIEGSFTTMMNSLWIILRQIEHTMVLRYDSSFDFHEWIIPGNYTFAIGSTPTNELLLFRSDGVWKLCGLGGPRHIYSARLDGRIDTFAVGNDYYVQLTDKNITRLFKSRYIGN